MEFRTATAYLTFVVALSFCSGSSLYKKEAHDPPCRAEVLRMTEEFLEGNQPVDLMELPQCDKDGYYKALQRNKEGYTCTTRLGSPVHTASYYVSGRGPCKEMKRCVRKNQAKGARDHKLIRCDRYGYYKEFQKTENPSKNICMTVYGRILKTENVSHERDCYDVLFVSAFAH